MFIQKLKSPEYYYRYQEEIRIQKFIEKNYNYKEYVKRYLFRN